MKRTYLIELTRTVPYTHKKCFLYTCDNLITFEDYDKLSKDLEKSNKDMNEHWILEYSITDIRLVDKE